MSEHDNDKKRKASEIDAIAVAPKKKFLAAQAEAGNDVKASVGASTVKKEDRPSSLVKTEVKDDKHGTSGKGTERSETSYSIRDNAPAGANAADSEEVLKFKNDQLYAALEAKKQEIKRLEARVSSLESAEEDRKKLVACVHRHWCALTEELKTTFQRLEHAPTDLKKEHSSVFESIMSLKDSVPEDIDSAVSSSCQIAQELMQEVVQSMMDDSAVYKRILKNIEEKSDDEALKAEVAKLSKRMEETERDFGKLQERHREYVVEEGRKLDEAMKKASVVEELKITVANLTMQLERAERRLVRSEQNFLQLKESGGSQVLVKALSTTSDGADANNEDVMFKVNEFRHLAESRLDEIKSLRKELAEVSVDKATTQASEELSDSAIVQSAPYLSLLDQFRQLKRECDSNHLPKLQQLSAELIQERERAASERKRLDAEHSEQVKTLTAKVSDYSAQLSEVKQELKAAQFKLEQKSAADVSAKRAEELSESLQKLQVEYSRLRGERERLKARPDGEELRREFREKEEKICKERDIKANEASDYQDQIKTLQERIALLQEKKPGETPNGHNAMETSLQREVESLKKEIEGLRTEKKDLLRKFQKADRGYHECNRLYQQHKKERDSIMKDLESLGLSFEELQERNAKLLESMRQKDEEYSEALRQRRKERQERELMLEEKSALRTKLDKAEELLKAKEDLIDKYKIELEAVKQETSKRQKEEECSVAMIAEHRKLIQAKEVAVKEARREVEKVKQAFAEGSKERKEGAQALQDLQYEKKRILEELESANRRLVHLEKRNPSGESGSADSAKDELLKHYRNCVKCFCNEEDKDRVLPCGHATCKKCVENLIKDRSRRCPSCGKKFDHSDVKPLFLQGSLGDT